MTKNTTASTSFKTETSVSETLSQTQVALPPVSYKIGGVTGDVARTDLIRPALNIVHGVGPLSEDFTPGQIVLNRELVIAEPEKPVTIMVLSLDKFFMENVPYGGDETARTFSSLEEVKKAGLHCDWINDQKPPCGPAAKCLVAIQRDDENGLYPFEFGGKHYAVAEWSLRGVAFTRAGKLIITAAQWGLKDGLHNGSWTLSTRREKLGVNWVWVPVLKAGPRNSKDLAEFFTNLG